MVNQQTLVDDIKDRFGSAIQQIECKSDMVEIEVTVVDLLDVCKTLRDDPVFKFEELVDVCAVDYLDYGFSHWRTEETTESGYSRGVIEKEGQRVIPWDKPRFAAVYHLLSLSNNTRLRIKVYLSGEPPLVPSVMNVWNSADWFEREAFDLMGIVFDGHSDLRRILTDYGFVGHPFRKDFPLVGEVELRYDAAEQRCLYESVSIQPRVLVPKVIRDDNRYHHEQATKSEG